MRVDAGGGARWWRTGRPASATAGSGEASRGRGRESGAWRSFNTRAAGGFGGALLRITTSEMSGPYPFERRLGAFPAGDGRAEFRVWAPRRERGRAARRRPRARARADAGYGVLEATVEAAPGEDYAYVDRGDRVPRPRHAAGSRTACAGARGCSTRARSPGPTRASRRRRCATPCSTSCTSARSRDEGTFDAAIPHLRGLRELGVTTIELMPRGRVPRPPRLGLRRRLHQRRARPLRRAGGPAAVRRRRPRRGPRGAARRRLQPRRRLGRRRAWSASAPTSPRTTRRRGAGR